MTAPRSPAFPALVFDFDGTLIDSAPDITRALNRTLAAFGRPPVTADQVRTMVGDGSAMLIRYAWRATGGDIDEAIHGDALKHYLESYHEEETTPACMYPGVPETLAALAAQGVRFGLCTNKPERIARKVLDLIGIGPMFTAVAGGDTLPVRKPDPQHLAWVLDKLGAGPGSAAMVGDNRHDVHAARGVGIPAVAVSYGYPRMPIADLGADIVIDRFADLPTALDRLAGRG